MRVFVAGATGVLGRRAVGLLVAAGHEVTGVARSPAKAALLRGLGATPAAIDLFDPAAVTEAAAGHEVVCNLATHIPPTTKAWRLAAWRENDRIRTEGSANLAAAAVATGARFVQESIAFAYPDRGDEWISEDEPIDPPPAAASVQAAEESAGHVAAAGGVAVVLRFGLFYGTGSSHTDDLVALAQRGLAPFPGAADAHFPTVHLDDAARAVVAALALGSGAYNVVDDGSLTRADHAAALAAAVGRRGLRLTPRWAVRLGGDSIAHLVRSQRPSNGKLHEAAGWEPRYPTPREGWPAVIAERGGLRPVAGLWQVLALVYLTVQGLSAGAQAAVAPRSFYDSFPVGRGWVAVDGPFNEHLVRDVGGFFLALGLLALVAALVRSGFAVRAAAAAWTVFATVHLAYHAANAGTLPTTIDRVASLSTLTATAVMAVALLVRPTPASA